MYVIDMSEPILGYDGVNKEDEYELFRTIAQRIEEEYIERPRFDDGTIIKVGDMADLDGSIKPVRDIRVGVFFDGKELVFTPTIKRFSDTVERIIEDAEKEVSEYWGCRGYFCESCPSKINGKEPYDHYNTLGCDAAQKLDLLHRMQDVLKQK